MRFITLKINLRPEQEAKNRTCSGCRYGKKNSQQTLNRVASGAGILLKRHVIEENPISIQQLPVTVRLFVRIGKNGNDFLSLVFTAENLLKADVVQIIHSLGNVSLQSLFINIFRVPFNNQVTATDPGFGVGETGPVSKTVGSFPY